MREIFRLDYFISSAYAGLSSTVDDAFKAGLEGLLKHLDYKDISAVAMSFDEALEEFLNLYKDLGPDGLSAALREVKRDTTTIKALMNIGEVAGGVDNMRRFAQNSGWTLGMRNALSVSGMVEAVANMRIDRLTRIPSELPEALPEAYAASVKNGLTRVLSQVDHKWGRNLTKGDMAHFLVVVDLLGRGKIIKGVEIYEAPIILNNRFVLAERRIDIIIEVDGLELLRDIKANVPLQWKSNLVKDMKLKVSNNAGEQLREAGPGQFLTDLGKQYREISNGTPAVYRQRVYTPEILGLEEKPTAKQIADMEDIMNAKVVEMIDDEAYDELLMDAMDMDKNKILGGDEIEIDRFVDAKNDLKQMVLGTHEKTEGLIMMKIYPFDHLVPPVQ